MQCGLLLDAQAAGPHYEKSQQHTLPEHACGLVPPFCCSRLTPAGKALVLFQSEAPSSRHTYMAGPISAQMSGEDMTSVTLPSWQALTLAMSLMQAIIRLYERGPPPCLNALMLDGR